MSEYVVAIPSYNRPNEIVNKTLKTLLSGGVSRSKIYIFVANITQERIYREHVPTNMYNKIIIGKPGIRNQRVFISKFFPEKQYIVSIDDDVDEILRLHGKDKLVKIKNVDEFFKDAHKKLEEEKLNIWGIYPVRNPFFMKHTITTDLRFIIGVLFGYVNRHDAKLYPSVASETKEDYEQTILFYKMDGGVLRYNYIVPKTRFNAPGGLGTERYDKNKLAAEHLVHKYPDIAVPFSRKNGMPEIRLIKLPRVEVEKK